MPPLGRAARRARGAVDPADLHEDSLAAVRQLLVGRPQVDHQIAVGLAEADHRAGRDRVEHELGGGARLHARGARDDLRAGDRQDHDVHDVERLVRRRRARDDRGGAPSVRAYSSARRTYGVVPDAAMPITKSPLRTPCAGEILAAPSTRSSAPSCERVSAASPPAMMPCTISGSVPNVGGHSDASSTPSRPEVPAPT